MSVRKNKITSSAPLVASVHRFRDKVGTYIGEADGTAYLSALEARAIAKKLVEAADSIEAEAFTDSNVGSLTITSATRF